MLALLCRVFADPVRRLPARRADLCDRCLRGLLKDWKREDKAAEVDDLDVETALSGLGQVALALYPASQFAITEVAEKLSLPPAQARKIIDGLIEDGILPPTDATSRGGLGRSLTRRA